MICPRCGSRDVLFSSNVDKEIHYCGCESCGYQWEEGYDPFSSAGMA